MPSPPHAQESPKVNGIPREQAGPSGPFSDRGGRSETDAMMELVRAYQINGENDRELLQALLKAKKGEEERKAAHSSLHNTVIRIRGTLSPPISRRAVSPPHLRELTSSVVSQSQVAASSTTGTGQHSHRSPREEETSPATDNLERQWLPSLSTVLCSLAGPEGEIHDVERIPPRIPRRAPLPTRAFSTIASRERSTSCPPARSSGFLSIPTEDWTEIIKLVNKHSLKPKPEVGIQWGAGGDASVEELNAGTRDLKWLIDRANLFLDTEAHMIMIESEGITENVEN
ncbi:hypothetical protein CALVIDRAFT_561828 [Calocera viscosa TUFC12733]|uniref:Uncharacterized protein n=1 Tax=Calocera viscosa (strain TUFC12733) TaxID=1330018 RepID=A0A167PKN9_CALVF|nr:hypothetical protein CALVIDRAFT_561828 [Calocera viscosa TUFC12733]